VNIQIAGTPRDALVPYPWLGNIWLRAKEKKISAAFMDRIRL